jgi:type III pantothenate kinase
MLLAIDIGNTQTVIGLIDIEKEGSPAPLLSHWRIATLPDRTADEHALVLKALLALDGRSMDSVSGMALSSSVPVVTAAMREMARRWFPSCPLVVVEPGVKTGMAILYDNPREVGADRIVNAIAAHHRFGGPTIVVDLGTATTFDAISVKGEYLGGAICPGVEISMEALFSQAAALVKVELVQPKRVIGKSTVESIQSGAIFGFAAQVDGLVSRFEEEMGKSAVVATGGLAELIAPICRKVQHIDPWLTLLGLELIWRRNL